MKQIDSAPLNPILFAGALILTAILLAPLIPCPSGDCGPVYRTRMQYARTPGLTREQAASIRRYAAGEPCPLCSGLHRVALVNILCDWLVQSTCSQRAS